MRVVLVHPNYHSGGAEIAGNWPPAWVAYFAGALKQRGYTDIHFVDAMTNNLGEDELRERFIALQPDIIGCTAITPSIYTAERVLEIAKETCPGALRVLGGIHATFMYKQVLSEAPWVDVIVRGEGEDIFSEVVCGLRCCHSRSSAALTGRDRTQSARDGRLSVASRRVRGAVRGAGE